MKQTLIISPQAMRDVQQSVDYYNSQQRGLGGRFARSAYDFIKRIAKMPQAASFSHSDVRYKVMTDFPFVVTYRFDDKAVYIIRVFNTSLHPGRL